MATLVERMLANCTNKRARQFVRITKTRVIEYACILHIINEMRRVRPMREHKARERERERQKKEFYK